MSTDLTGRIMIITGASSGIGAATAIECARAGMDLVLNVRRADRLEAIAGAVREHGRQAVTVVEDVAGPGISDRLLDAAEEAFGSFHTVFANAGYGMHIPIVQETDDDHRRMFDVNYFASVDLLRTAARRLVERGRPGHLLMCSSCVSKFTLPRHGTYCATKAAQNAVCSAMRLEHAGDGVSVSSVHPITTTTEFVEVSARLSGRTPPPGGRPPHAPRLFTQPPERVARAIVRCLRRPRPEVWTSHTVRIVAGVMTVFPRFGDWMMKRQMREEMADEGKQER